MNMRDLSKDDDFLSHLLVEKLGAGGVPLFVHKMDPSRKLPKTDANDLLQVVRRLVMNKAPIQHAIRQAVDELLMLPAVRYYLKSYVQKQINAFATHASRYFELYHPSGSIEIAHTSRYAHRTGKSELCILATRNLAPGSVIAELKGSMANLTEEEDKELKRTDLQNSDIRRDFSVIHSKQMKKNHLFLGPARFVNHDCDNNCELFREGKYITFRVLKSISVGEEITAHYGDGYFGRKNRHCLCETCEKNGRGGYAPDYDENEPEPNSSSDSETESISSLSDSGSELTNLNINERRTRRGVYAILKKGEEGEEESDDSEEEVNALTRVTDDQDGGEIELLAEVDTDSAQSMTPSLAIDPPSRALSTAASTGPVRSQSSLSSLSSDTPVKAGNTEKMGTPCTPYRSIISTRRQKAQEEADKAKAQPAVLSIEDGTPSHMPRHRRSTRSSSVACSSENAKGMDKTLTPVTTPISKRRSASKDEVSVKREEVEPRNLRARPSTIQASDGLKVAPVRETPRGPDGKPLPLCITCSNVLPVISVDSKVVWGLGFESSPRKKKQKLECPRCMRHFAIYARPWPCRLPTGGHSPSFIPTPREEVTPIDSSTRRVTHKALPVLDRKLQAAAAAASVSSTPKLSSKRRDQNCEGERPPKRAKVEVAQGSLASRSKAPSDSTSGAKEATNLEQLKRKRGRPRIHFPETKQPVRVKEEEDAMSLPGMPKQPRNINGQFGRKSNAGPQAVPGKPSTSTDVWNNQAKASSEGTIRNGNNQNSVSSSSPRQRKRVMDIVEAKEEHPRKRTLRKHGNGPPDTGLVVEDVPLQRVLPHPSSFRGIRLLSNPNPLSFALQAWGGTVVLDESSSSSDEDDKGVVTPEDDLSPPAATVVDPDDISRCVSPVPTCLNAPVLPRGALTCKPSPFTFAKRRWASVSDSPHDQNRVLEPDASGSERVATVVAEYRGSSDGLLEQHARLGLPLYYSFHNALTDEEQDKSNNSSGSDGRSVAVESQGECVPLRLQHVYPSMSRDVKSTSNFHKSVAFPLTDSTPTFIRAGWDSCSDLSDS
ncbi:hypothetical protein AX17_004528 [Amanita inopinata Kibby_2008]|nr:hypothetical protein AX17_004528 [Amanita inopinata Kibby_2008]